MCDIHPCGHRVPIILFLIFWILKTPTLVFQLNFLHAPGADGRVPCFTVKSGFSKATDIMLKGLTFVPVPVQVPQRCDGRAVSGVNLRSSQQLRRLKGEAASAQVNGHLENTQQQITRSICWINPAPTTHFLSYIYHHFVDHLEQAIHIYMYS